jgi:hypothetical protein
MTSLRQHAFLTGVLFGAFTLASCGVLAAHPPKSIAVKTVREQLPELNCTTADPLQGRVCAAIQPGARLAITLWGSGSCPTLPTSLVVLSPNRVRIVASDDWRNATCTADLSPTTSVVVLPRPAVDVTSPLTVDVLLPDGPLEPPPTGARLITLVADPVS